MKKITHGKELNLYRIYGILKKLEDMLIRVEIELGIKTYEQFYVRPKGDK